MINSLQFFLQIRVGKKLSAFAIGANSGLIFALISSTFTVFLFEQNFSFAAVGWLSLRLFPYSFKYFFAPIVDSISQTLASDNLRRYKLWMLAMQLLLLVILIDMAILSYLENYTYAICALSFVLALAAALYDIALEAYRIELFRDGGANIGNGLVVSGFRLGLLYSGAFALYASTYFGWHGVFLLIAFAVLISMLILLFSADQDEEAEVEIRKIPNLKPPARRNFKKFIKEGYWKPISAFAAFPNAALLLMLIAFYKVSDSFLDTMIPVFLLETGFSKQDIAVVAKSVGVLAFLLGTTFGAYCLHHFKMGVVLIVCEALAASTNLLFILLIWQGADNTILLWINFAEVFCSAMCNIVLITFMSSLCMRKFTLVHFAFLQSISSIMRLIFGAISGKVVVLFGWTKFFILSSVLSIPALICVIMLVWNRTPQLMHISKLKINQYY